jgi:adenylate cyclase
MGIHQGKVTLGSIGSSSNLIDITMLGDAVNVTSRIESSNKSYGTNLLVSEQFLRNLLSTKKLKQIGKIKVKTKNVSKVLMFREVDYVKFVGKDTPLKIYEIIY